MAADFRLIPHTAKRHTHKIPPRRLGDGFAERGLADTRRAHQAQDRSTNLGRARLHRQIFDDAFLYLLKPVVISIENLLRCHDIPAHPALLLPGDGQHPIQVVAHHGRFRTHGAHAAEFLDLGQRLFARFLGEFGGFDLGFDFGDFVLAVFAFAKLLLNRLQLFVQVIFALRLFHLPLHAAADALFHLQHADLAFHMGEDFFKPRGDRR